MASGRSAPTRGTFEARLRRSAPLLAIALAALALRAVVVLWAWPSCSYDPHMWEAGGLRLDQAVSLNQAGDGCYAVASDAVYYYGQGKMLAAGEGFGNPVAWTLLGQYVPSAQHPPAYSVYLAAGDEVGLGSVTQQRLATAALGAAAVFVLGLVAQGVAGRRAGLIAAGLAAVNPMLIINDVKLMSEALYVLTIALVLLAAFHFWRRPRPATAALLGVAIAAAELTRPEAGMLAVVLVVPLAYHLRDRLRPAALVKLGLVAFLVTQLVVFPMVVRNLTTFDEPALVSYGTGSVMLNGSCDETFYGDQLGYYSFECFAEHPELTLTAMVAEQSGRSATIGGPNGVTTDDIGQAASSIDESEVDAKYRGFAFDYLRANASRVPVVVAARVGRMFGVYRPLANVDADATLEDRTEIGSQLGLLMYALLWVPALYGGSVLWRRKVPISPFVALAIAVTVAAAVSFGITRYRVPVDASLCVLAGVGIDAFIRSRLSRARSSP